jgi:hypothetical protein
MVLHNSIGLVVSDKKILKISANENTLDPGSHVGFQISTKKHKSGRGPSNEHFWQVWLKSVQRFQRRRLDLFNLMKIRSLTAPHFLI